MAEHQPQPEPGPQLRTDALPGGPSGPRPTKPRALGGPPKSQRPPPATAGHGGAAPSRRSHGARLVRGAVGEHLLRGGHGRAAHARAAAAAGAVLDDRPHGPHGGRAQLGAGQAGGQRGLERGHHLGGRAAAAAHGGVGVADDDGVQGAGGLRADGAWRVLQRLQGVQHHIWRLLDRVLSLELPQLVQSCAHGLLDVLGTERASGQHRVWRQRVQSFLHCLWASKGGTPTHEPHGWEGEVNLQGVL